MLKKFEFNLNQKNFFLSIFVISFFLPNFDLTIRADHFAVYIFLLISFFYIFLGSFNLKIATIFVKNNNFIVIELFLFILVIICLFLSTINFIFTPDLFEPLLKNKINILSALAVLDNYLLNISIFVLCFFFFYKDTDEIFNYFAHLIIILLCINSVYSLFEIIVVNLDENCSVFRNSKQSVFCTIIAAIDVSYSNPSFSSAILDYIERSNHSFQVKKELLHVGTNSTSIGWISLTAGRSQGIFNMPIEGAVINAGGLLLLFILFFLDKKNKLEKISESKKKYYCFAFFLLLLSSILCVSKITSHFTLPAALFLILLNRKELKFIISSKYFKFSAAVFFLVLILLVNLNWKGYNHYYNHALRYLIILCDVTKTTCKFPAEIIDSKESIAANEVGNLAKKIDFEKIFLETKTILPNHNKIFQAYLDKKKNMIESETNKESFVDKNYSKSFYENILVYLNYLSGGRHGSIDPFSITILKQTGSILGYGVLIQESFDQMKNYLVFYSGQLSYYLYLIFEIIPFYLFILYKKKFKNTPIKIILIFIFSLYLLASLGGPIYFMNRVSVIYFAALVYFLLKLKIIKNSKSNV